MKKIKKQAWLAASAVIIAGNLYLIFKEDSKAGRTEWLARWEQAETRDVVESFEAKGVVVPADEYAVYVDSSVGPLEEVLVEEGDTVTQGTDLFTYSSAAIDERINELTLEKEQLEQEISLIDDQISQMRILLSQAERKESLPETTTEAFSYGDSETIVVESDAATTNLENEIIQQLTNKRKLEENVKKYESLIDVQELKRNDLVVKSTADGYVKFIDTTLAGPLMVINSSSPAVQGLFDEKQVHQVQKAASSNAALSIEATVDTTSKQFEGLLSSVSQYPEEEPSVKRKSLYPFSAQLTEVKTSDLYPGLKTTVKVITHEKQDAVTIPSSAILMKNNKKYAIVVNNAGLLERREISSDLNNNGVYAITSGVSTGEAIVLEPYRLLKKNGPFVTPVHADQLKKKAVNEMSRTEKIKYTLIGILS